MKGRVVVLFANSDWYIYNFRRSLAIELRSAGYEVLLISPDGPYGPKLCELGFRWIKAPMLRRSLNPLRELVLLFWLKRLFLRERVDLVHAFTIKCAVYGSLASRMAGRIVRLNAITGLGYIFSSGDCLARLLRPVVSILLRFALGGEKSLTVLQNVDDVAVFERSSLVSPSVVRVIKGSGVDCTRFFPASESLAFHSARPLRVLFPARLLWDKGVAEFIEAARLLRNEGRVIDFLLAGSPDPGNPASVPESIVRSWVEEGVVQWLGHVDDMPTLFRSVDVVVLPSYREGLPKGLIEAGACALPLVTTDTPGCREVVSNGVDGLRVPVKDGTAIACAIARLQDNPVLRRRLGIAARNKVLAEFDEHIVIQQTLAVYDELLWCD